MIELICGEEIDLYQLLERCFTSYRENKALLDLCYDKKKKKIKGVRFRRLIGNLH
jgi:hypothetical protein